ncbi:MAG: substrate-binding domain-containing protein [Oscillospiraceae bacterium]|nr:substrate-binding domain-containing protein [Oscillospiraceae bacterium]
MKRIGVVIPAITDNLQSELLGGITATAAAAGCDVIVLTTATNGLDFHMQSEIMEGEESIYALLGQARLDGVLLASQYFVKETVRQRISAIIRKAGLPCIDLGGTALGFETVHIPQDQAVQTLTDHLIEQHGCRKLLFLSGHAGNPDAEQRMQGFLRSAEAHHCAHEVFYGDFWKVRAAELGAEILQHKREKPDAVICASDMMAVTLCDTLQSGGLSVPDDIIVTGFDGHIFALSSFPTLTTIGGAMDELGRIATAQLLGMRSCSPRNARMHIIYGASCGCVERMADYQAAALQVQQQIRRDSSAADMLEMQINADIITRTSLVESLSELTDVVDQTAHIIRSYRSLHLCLLPDWDGNPEQPDICKTKPFPRQMLCAVSKPAGVPCTLGGVFPTAGIVPMLSEPHEPVLLFVLPLHASSQVFGYCVLEYAQAADFTVSVLLFHLLSAVANGLRMLRHKRYAEYLQQKIEEASLYDKMTDMLSRKGLLLHLEKQKHASARCGMMLVTIAKLAATPNGQHSSRLPDTVLQSELLLANAIRMLSGRDLQTARLDKRTFAVVFPLAEQESPERISEEMMIQLEVLIRKMQEGSAAAFLPEPYYVCGEVTFPAADCMAALWDTLNSSKPKDKGFTGISQLKKLRREIHKAPELAWNLTELAKRLNISRSYVQKLYKEQFGISYMDDLIDARISRAKQLLTTTDLRIQEVAASCGYQNSTHFMRQFREKTGMSPSAFRELSD